MHLASFSKLARVAFTGRVSRVLAGSAAALALAALIGCAVGSDPGVDISQLDSLPVEAGGPAEDSSTTVLPPSTRPTDMTGEDAAADAGTGDAASTVVDSGGGTDAATGVDSGGGMTTSCGSLNVCTAGTDLGTISGDTGADVKTASGTGSQWFTIRVNENDSSISPMKLRTKAELVSPPGTNFDVFIYVAGGSSGQECSAVKASSTNASGADSATADWGESGLFSNGSDDSRTVTIEVRWISGVCSTAAPWALTVRGNTP
jgi:hypothetical protein